MSFSLNQLTEGIKARNVGQGNRRLLEKWGRTGLLRGLDGVGRENMATLLENQAGQVLREASTLGGDGGGSDIRGFTNIAFPIVRRVFGGLIANELVSIQPMSLPSGLLFYLDYTYGTSVGGDIGTTEAAYKKGDSIYGQPVNPGKNGGADAVGGPYDLVGAGYTKSRVEKEAVQLPETALNAGDNTQTAAALLKLGAFGSDNAWAGKATGGNKPALLTAAGQDLRLLDFDPQLVAEIEAGEEYAALFIPWSTENFPSFDARQVKEITINSTQITGLGPVPSKVQAGDAVANVKRLNRIVKSEANAAPFSAKTRAPEVDGTAGPISMATTAATHFLLMIVKVNGTVADNQLSDADTKASKSVIDVSGVKPAGTSAEDLSTVVSPAFESDFAVDEGDIPEIDIKIESVSVVAQTRKLRAKWSPELAQDLNAYHSLDAEVELTQILSEQVALEIDREILGDLLGEAGAANFFWSRSPGNFVNKRTGIAVSRATSLRPGPAFTGTVREWYETLVETIIDVSNEIHRKTLRGSGNFMVVSPEVATILEASVLYKPALTLDGDGQVGMPMALGAEKVGTLSSRFTVYKDPYFPRNKILVGFKGSSYLETGYVYAPYVPLIVTPTIFAPEDFTPRKGVMTRYGKKMVRSDFYGTVTCLDMDII